MTRSQLRAVTGALSLAPMLSACCIYTPPPPPEGTQFRLSFPANSAGEGLRPALLWIDAAGRPHLLGNTGYPYYGPSESPPTGTLEASLFISKSDLDTLTRNHEFVRPFLEQEAAGKTQVVAPASASTGNLYPVLWRDANGDGALTDDSEVVYDTHDTYTYANEAFTYSYQLGRASETGARKQGWSHIRHVVLNPSDTPNQYLITMNPVEGTTYFLHEPSDYATSMSVRRGD